MSGFVCLFSSFSPSKKRFVYQLSFDSHVSWRALREWMGLFISLPQLGGHSIWAFLSSTHICIFLNVATVSRSFACFHCIFNNYWVLYSVNFWNIVPDFEIFFLWIDSVFKLYFENCIPWENFLFSYPGTLRVWLDATLFLTLHFLAFGFR